MATTKKTTTKRTKAPAKEIYTTNDLAQHFGWNAKALRRRMRAKGLNVGKGNRHTFTKENYDRVVAQLTK